MKTHDVARHLAGLYTALREADRPVDRKVAAAALDGACSALHAAGLGMTPTEVRLAVQDACDRFGPRPAQTAGNADRQAWSLDVVDTLGPTLRGLWHR